MTTENPDWEDSGSIKTWHKAWYQIDNAKPVVLQENFNRDSEAAQAAVAAMNEALKKVKELGLFVEISTWTVKHQDKLQHREFDAVAGKHVVTAMWYGNWGVVDKQVHEKEPNSVIPDRT